MLSRRDWMTLSAAGVLGPSLSGWLGRLARAAAPPAGRARACVLLWMNGGPSQMDTFDLKPGHANGGGLKEIATRAPGLRVSEHLPTVAKFGDRIAVVRSMTTKEGDHGRAAHYLRTGYFPGGTAYPTLGSLVSKELGDPESSLPRFVSVAPFRAFNPAAYAPGFLGPMHAPLIVADAVNRGGPAEAYADALRVKDLEPPALRPGEMDSRVGLLDDLERDFSADRPDTPPRSHQAAYARAVRLMRSSARKAFDLDEEKPAVRDAYGRNLFGQGCLLARRLVERGVPFVEVTHAGTNGIGWDTHQNNLDQVKNLCGTLDPAWGMLMSDLKDRGLLDSTLIVWMGEFGRTPKINPNSGRDHYPNAWSVALAGGGIRGGHAHGATTADGMEVARDPVSVPDFLATVVRALGIDHEKANLSGARPIKLVERGGTPIKGILG
ncbi:MAG: DUF1501 domain-containing protein [Gemmataceae bacterium]